MQVDIPFFVKTRRLAFLYEARKKNNENLERYDKILILST